MSISDAQFTAWLSNPSSIRCTLADISVRVSGTETTRYISTVGYVMPDASIAYEPILSNSIRYTEQLSANGAGLSVGDIEIANPNGERDSWLDDVWVGRSIVVLFGDVRWDKSDFRIIFNGIVADINSRNRTTLNLQIRDKLQRLNTPVTDTKLGGSTSNKDVVLPLVFGEVHNIEPLLIDPTILQYQVHNGPIERIIEVRDNGVIIPTTNHISTGKFELIAQLIGTLTCSVQGAKPSTYNNTISQLVQLLVTSYGKVADRFTSADLDATNLAAFDTAHPQPVGHYLSARENVLVTCQTLANSVGAQLVMSRAGKLRLIQLTLPITGTFTVNESDIIQNSLQIVNTSDVISSVKLGYCKNWTVQTELQTGVPPEHKALYALDWLTNTQSDSTVAGIYKLDAEPEQINTSLLTDSDGIAEASRRLTMNKIPRTTYRFTGLSRLMELELGQGITLINRRFGLSAGKDGIITALTPNWETARVDVEVII